MDIDYLFDSHYPLHFLSPSTRSVMRIEGFAVSEKRRFVLYLSFTK